MNSLTMDSDWFEFDSVQDELTSEQTNHCLECGSDLNREMHKERCSQCNYKFDELELDQNDLEWEAELKRRRKRSGRPTRRRLQNRRRFSPRINKKSRPIRPKGLLRSKSKYRRDKPGKRPLKIRQRRRPVIIHKPATPCICPAHGTEFVRWVQSSLNQILGLRLRINGVMNRSTRDALRRFQKQEGLPVDGIAGPETEKSILNVKVGRTQESGQTRDLEDSYDINLNRELEIRESLWRMRPPVRYQRDEYICWAAAISSWSIITKGVRKFKTTKSVLDYFRPRGVLNTDDSLILPDGMEEVRRLFDLKFKKIKGGGSLSSVNIRPLLKHSHLIVVFKRPGADYYHFVVVYGVDRFNICFMDPELNPSAPGMDKIKRNRVCAKIYNFGAGATEFFVFWKE